MLLSTPVLPHSTDRFDGVIVNQAFLFSRDLREKKLFYGFCGVNTWKSKEETKIDLIDTGGQIPLNGGIEDLQQLNDYLLLFR